MSINEILDLLFDEETGLVDPKKGHHGICLEFNVDAVKTIEEMLDIDVEYYLTKAMKLNLVVKKQRLDKNNKQYHLFYRITEGYKKDNSEQLRKVMNAVTRFKDKDKPIE